VDTSLTPLRIIIKIEAGLAAMEKRKILPLPGIAPRLSSQEPVTIPTVLSRISIVVAEVEVEVEVVVVVVVVAAAD
jgi:hypothetical protein